MRARPFEFGGLAFGGGEMQRRAVVASDSDAHPLRREGDAFHRARMVEGLHLAVGEAHEGGAAAGIGDGALRTGRDRRHPFARHLGERLGRAVRAGERHLAVLAAGDQRLAVPGHRRAEQSVMRRDGFRAVVEAVDRPVGQCEMRDVVEEGGGDAVAGKIEGRDCGHVFDYSRKAFGPLIEESGARRDRHDAEDAGLLPVHGEKATTPGRPRRCASGARRRGCGR